MKQYIVKIYDKGKQNFLGFRELINNLSFTKTVNGGLGDATLLLPIETREIQSSLFDHSNHVEIWLRDQDINNGRLIYSGYISDRIVSLSGRREQVSIECLGYASLLEAEIYRNGLDPYREHNSQDPSFIVRDIIDQFANSYGANPPITTSIDTAPNIGYDISRTFTGETCRSALSKLVEITGQYWYVGEDGVLVWQPRPTTPTHKFVPDRDIVSIEANSDTKNIKNNFLFWNGVDTPNVDRILMFYQNAESSDQYFNRWEVLTDSRVTNQDTADALGSAFINLNKDPESQISMTIKDNNFGLGYDIESIQPGDTFSIINVDDGNFLRENVFIHSVSYTPESVILRTDTTDYSTSQQLTKIRRQLKTDSYLGLDNRQATIFNV